MYEEGSMEKINVILRIVKFRVWNKQFGTVMKYQISGLESSKPQQRSKFYICRMGKALWSIQKKQI